MKLITVAMLLSLLSWNGFGAGQGGPIQAERAQVESKTSPLRLKLKLVSPSETVCFGDSLTVEAELANESNQDVAIDIKRLWHQSSFQLSRVGPSQINPDGSGSELGVGGLSATVACGGSGYHGEYIILSPKDSYSETRTFEMENGFFDNPGDFTMNTAYGQFCEVSFAGMPVWKGVVESDNLKFKVGDCNQ